MKCIMRFALAAVTIATAGALVSCAPAYMTNGGTRTYLGFTLGIASDPPPVLTFGGAPRMDPVEDSDVQVIDCPDPDADLFQYQGACYLYRAGFWYRSDRYDGPYRPIEVHRVPRAVLDVPAGHWRHRPQRDSDDQGRGHAHGHDKGDDHDGH